LTCEATIDSKQWRYLAIFKAWVVYPCQDSPKSEILAVSNQ